MDDRNYVAPTPDGRFDVVVDGEWVGTYPTQGEAERAFNDETGDYNAPPGGTPSTGSLSPALGRSPSFPVVGGMAQLDPYMQALQLALQTRRLNEMDIPNAEWLAAMSYMDRTGFKPKGLRSPFSEPSYQTVNGPRTIQEMRRELIAAGGNEWEKKNDAEVIAGYARTAVKPGTQEKGDVTRRPLFEIPEYYGAGKMMDLPANAGQAESIPRLANENITTPPPEKPPDTGIGVEPSPIPLNSDELARRWIAAMKGRY